MYMYICMYAHVYALRILHQCVGVTCLVSLQDACLLVCLGSQRAFQTDPVMHVHVNMSLANLLMGNYDAARETWIKA